MEGLSKYLRLPTKAVIALVAAGLVLPAMAGSASASRCPNIVICVKDVSVGIVNNSKTTAIRVQICPNGHVSTRYQLGLQSDPCSAITETFVIGANGQRKTIFNTNPLGIIITPNYPFGVCETAPCPFGVPPVQNKTLYFYASNPYFGKPFFRAQGFKIELSEHHEMFHKVDGVHVGFLRYGDEDRNGASVKLMRIEIRKWP
jgi:hypothetical protein